MALIIYAYFVALTIVGGNSTQNPRPCPNFHVFNIHCLYVDIRGKDPR